MLGQTNQHYPFADKPGKREGGADRGVQLQLQGQMWSRDREFAPFSVLVSFSFSILLLCNCIVKSLTIVKRMFAAIYLPGYPGYAKLRLKEHVTPPLICYK